MNDVFECLIETIENQERENLLTTEQVAHLYLDIAKALIAKEEERRNG